MLVVYIIPGLHVLFSMLIICDPVARHKNADVHPAGRLSLFANNSKQVAVFQCLLHTLQRPCLSLSAVSPPSILFRLANPWADVNDGVAFLLTDGNDGVGAVPVAVDEMGAT